MGYKTINDKFRQGNYVSAYSIYPRRQNRHQVKLDFILVLLHELPSRPFCKRLARSIHRGPRGILPFLGDDPRVVLIPILLSDNIAVSEARRGSSRGSDHDSLHLVTR